MQNLPFLTRKIHQDLSKALAVLSGAEGSQAHLVVLYALKDAYRLILLHTKPYGTSFFAEEATSEAIWFSREHVEFGQAAEKVQEALALLPELHPSNMNHALWGILTERIREALDLL